MDKVCNRCLKTKNTNDFYTNKKNKPRFICKECNNTESKKYRKENKEKMKSYRKEYRKKNRELLVEESKKYRNSLTEKEKQESKKYNKRYQKKNREKLRIKKREYYFKNKERLIEKSKKYIKNNPEKIKKYREDYKGTRNYLRRERNKKDKLYYLESKIRKIIFYCFNSRGFKKSKKLQNILGCTTLEFKIYLESKFESWMNWENYGKYNGELNYGWDIDHTVPISSAKTIEDIIKLNHYTNLQPLCSKVNRHIKREKY